MSSPPNLSCSVARDSSVVSCVVHIVSDALNQSVSPTVNMLNTQRANLSKEPGVMAGVSPTLKLLDFFAFLS